MADLTSSTDQSPRAELSAGTRERRRRGRARDRSTEAARPARKVDYRRLVNPFEPVRVYSDDRIAAIHDMALKVLEELGMRLLLPAALDLLRTKGPDGVLIDDEARHCRFDRGLVVEAIATAPAEWTLHGGTPETSAVWGGRHVVWCAVGGAPHISDLDDGKRPGTLEASSNIMRLCEHYDVMHVQGPNVEAQDIDTAFRHLEVTRAQLVLSNKAPFVYCRGKGQVADGMEMVRIARGLSEEAFRNTPCVYTVINTNSPLVLDRPMLQGIMDYAANGQPILLTPFTLSGAMAPVTIPGALVQQHAEFLAGLVISQLTPSPGRRSATAASPPTSPCAAGRRPSGRRKMSGRRSPAASSRGWSACRGALRARARPIASTLRRSTRPRWRCGARRSAARISSPMPRAGWKADLPARWRNSSSISRCCSRWRN